MIRHVIERNQTDLDKEKQTRKWFSIRINDNDCLLIGLKANNRDIIGYNSIVYAVGDSCEELVAYGVIIGIEVEDSNAYSSFQKKIIKIMATIKCTTKLVNKLGNNYHFCNWHIEHWKDLDIWIVCGKCKDKLPKEDSEPIYLFFSDTREEAIMQCALRGIVIDEH